MPRKSANPTAPPVQFQEPDNRTISQKIADGDYYLKGDGPGPRPKKPELLSKPAGELTEDELANLTTVRSEYVNALSKHDAILKSRRDEEIALQNKFYADVMEDFGFDKDCAFCQQLYSVAYERGHSGGYNDIYCCLSDLMPLYAAAKKMAQCAVDKAVRNLNSASTNPAAMAK